MLANVGFYRIFWLLLIVLQASCRRNFPLDVVSQDACGKPISKDMEVFVWTVHIISMRIVKLFLVLMINVITHFCTLLVLLGCCFTHVCR